MPSSDKAPPRPGAMRLLRQLLPSWLGCGLLTLGLVALAAGLAATALIAATNVDADGTPNPGVSLFFFSLVFVPVVALFSALAAAASPRVLARSLLMLATSAILLLGSFSCGRGMIALKTPPAQAWSWSIASYGGLACVMGVAGIAALLLAPKRLREDLERDRREHVRAVIAQAGSASIPELAASLRVQESAILGLLVALIGLGEKLRVEDGAGRVYTAARGRELMEQLGAAVVGRGRSDIAELARELGEPVEIVEGWIGELLMAGRIVASIDRERGLAVCDPLGDGRVGARELVQLDCDGCGGALRAIGGGLYRCVYCGSEWEAPA